MSSPPMNTADLFKSVARQHPRKHTHPSIYQPFYYTSQQQQQQQQQQQHHSTPRVLYPLSSSGRGFIPNHNQQPTPPHVSLNPPFGSNSYASGPANPKVKVVICSYLILWSLTRSTSPGDNLELVSIRPERDETVDPSDQPKVGGQSSVAADNSLKNIRDKNGDDTFVIIRDRKVQVSKGTSLYAQCRSWLKNGFILEKPPQYADHVKSLPKPLPASTVEPRNNDEMEIEEKTEDVEHLSAKELLQQHVKHAKKVRARLRNQRLQRIERYKDRLALLLPPVVDQQTKTDPAS